MNSEELHGKPLFIGVSEGYGANAGLKRNGFYFTLAYL